MNAPTRHRTLYLVAAGGVGLLLAVPVGWLLATLVLLPAFLGLFFDMLFGLMVGAAVYRVARPACPVPRVWAATLGVLVAAAVWLVSLVGEYYNVRGYDLPRYTSVGWQWFPVDGDATRSVRRFFSRKALTREQLETLRSRTRQAFQQQLRERYPPGGFLGFLKWSAAKEGSLNLPRVFSASTHALNPKQRGTIWLVRVALSFILLIGAVLSQALGLAQPPGSAPPGAAGAPDRRSEPPSDGSA